MLFIESERMANCLYHPDDCESERTVIISELQGGENDPDQFLDQELVATAFKAHPYRHPTIGWLSDLQAMTRDDLYGYYRRYYIPNNATLVIVGDVDADDALRRVGAALRQGARRRGSARLRTVEPEQTGERRVVDSKARHDGLPESGVSRARRDRSGLLRAACPRCRAVGRLRHEPVGELPDACATAKREALPSPGPTGSCIVRERVAPADRAAVRVHHLGHRDRWHAARGRRVSVAGGTRRGRRERHHAGGARPRPRLSSRPGSCSTTTA